MHQSAQYYSRKDEIDGLWDSTYLNKGDLMRNEVMQPDSEDGKEGFEHEESIAQNQSELRLLSLQI